jgi:excinuclease ABC subunit A
MTAGKLIIKGARVHNLRNIDVELPRRSLVVVTGPSGSGKSSLAFDTLYAEGQRRYIESLSSFAHQFLDQLPKPEVDRIEGLSPALAIDQKGLGSNPRSTVGTITEISNYLRLLYARCGDIICPDCEVPATSRPLSEIQDAVGTRAEGTRLWILAPVVMGRKGAHKKLLEDLREKGFVRAQIDGELVDLDEPVNLAAGARHDIAAVVDGLIVRPGVERRLSDAVSTAVQMGGGSVLVREGTSCTLYSKEAACPSCSRSFPTLEPRLFSFNSPAGSCRSCQGLGTLPTIRDDVLVPDPSLSLADGAVEFLRGKESSWLFTQIEAFSGAMEFSLQAPWHELPDDVHDALLHGMSKDLVAKLKNHQHFDAFLVDWVGLIPELLRRHRETKSEKVRRSLEALMTPETCVTCEGHRLCQDALSVRIGGLHVGEVGDLTLSEVSEWVAGLSFTDPVKLAVAGPVLDQVRERCRFLVEVGVSYLSLARNVSTLSGGEGQRVRLATQVGSKLTGVLYVLDEPSVGLHHRDIHRLIATLEKLRDRGNSVIVVEHDLDIMRAADHLLDIGPGAGEHGGLVVASGTPAEVAANPDSETGRWLDRRNAVQTADPVSGGAPAEHWLKVQGMRGRNLQGIDLNIPLERLTVVTGVSGSGKSTAVHETLYRILARDLNRAGQDPAPYDTVEGVQHLGSVILVNQSPIGRSPRSTPATYTGLMTHLRKLYAQTTVAKMRGYGAGRFSFNTGDGRCPSCDGAGVRRLTMDFLPDVQVPCEVCEGKRFNPETLEVHFKGKTIADVLDMPVEEALEFFEAIPPCRRLLSLMDEVGLGYLRLGQQGATLSGGEAQRLKLSKELSRGHRTKSLYVLDEPTTGLHFCDVARLMDIVALLVSQGQTVVVIEHNPEVIRRADHVIDLGPEGGIGGGEIVAQGSVMEVAATAGSHTGTMLNDLLAGR